MNYRLETFVAKLNAWVDWFIPAHLSRSPDTIQAVRMFLFSHLFGPFLGHTISLSMLYIDGRADLSWWILFIAITAFWPLPFVLRWTGWYVPLALLSVENLMFCIFWGCYQYGGISSPIMPWLVTVPLLAFFYLPERSTRIAVAILIATNLMVFYGTYETFGFPETVAPQSVVVLGLISTLCASAYVSMMALYFASIVYSQGELEREIQRHQSTERRLRDATEQSTRALMAKSGFLARMSHELKNPLNAVIGYSEILIEDLDANETQKHKDLTSIRTAGGKLLGLIDALLELSTLEAGKMQLRQQEFEFSDFFGRMASLARPGILGNGNEFVVEPPAVGKMICDLQKLERVVEGLLSNAAKFTVDGRITFSAALQGDTWVMSIADTGIGIAQARMATLFETFDNSSDESASKYVDEVRLGLPMAYRYCQLMGGRLAIVSAPDSGSTVTVSLPRTPHGTDASAVVAMNIAGQAA